MLCMTMPFQNLQITMSDISPHIKWAVSLVIAYGHFNVPHGFVWVNILTLSSPRVITLGLDLINVNVQLPLYNRMLYGGRDGGTPEMISSYI